MDITKIKNEKLVLDSTYKFKRDTINSNYNYEILRRKLELGIYETDPNPEDDHDDPILQQILEQREYDISQIQQECDTLKANLSLLLSPR